MSNKDAPRQAEILVRVTERLETSGKLIEALKGKNYFNHIPQDQKCPFMRYRWSQAQSWDTKNSQGLNGTLTFDVWSDYRGDKEALEIQDILNDLFHENELKLTIGQNLILRRETADAFIEPDGITHHSISQYAMIVTN